MSQDWLKMELQYTKYYTTGKAKECLWFRKDGVAVRRVLHLL